MEKKQKIELAADLLGWTTKQAEECCREQPELNALYFFYKAKGGISMLMDADGGVLFANSSVTPDEHKQAFLKGIRTPLEAFLKNKRKG